MSSESPRILIVTAAFGEGHNSAARNLSIAFQEKEIMAQVVDPCLLGAPGITSILSRGYRLITNRTPSLWAAFYRSTDRLDFGKRRSPVMRFPERALSRLIDDFQPQAVVCTYPLYPYFLKRIPATMHSEIPVFTVVTDSIEINAAWLRAPSHWWLVTDATTRRRMVDWGIDACRVVETGFPVHPVFAGIKTVSAEDSSGPFRILYFATARRGFVRDHGEALLEASPDTRLTIVMGRNARRLLPEARRLKLAYPDRVKLIGWTRRVPSLLASHHLVVGKAGGATVHEAIAARCPMLIHHLVPGQEEGNLKLLEQLRAGGLADSPARLQEEVARLLEGDRASWRDMKLALEKHNRKDGAQTAVRFILEQLSS